jgi:hypothetical protein
VRSAAAAKQAVQQTAVHVKKYSDVCWGRRVCGSAVVQPVVLLICTHAANVSTSAVLLDDMLMLAQSYMHR